MLPHHVAGAGDIGVIGIQDVGPDNYAQLTEGASRTVQDLERGISSTFLAFTFEIVGETLKAQVKDFDQPLRGRSRLDALSAGQSKITCPASCV
jgi:hypothetical protein